MRPFTALYDACVLYPAPLRSLLMYGAGSQGTAYLGKNTPSDGLPATAEQFDAFSGFTGGVLVG